MARKSQKPKPKKARKTLLPGASPISGVVPPVEHRFQPGKPGGPGRPRKLAELKELILNTLAEETHDAEGRRTGLTRANMRSARCHKPFSIRAPMAARSSSRNSRRENSMTYSLDSLLRLPRAQKEQAAQLLAEKARRAATPKLTAQ